MKSAGLFTLLAIFIGVLVIVPFALGFFTGNKKEGFGTLSACRQDTECGRDGRCAGGNCYSV